VRGSLGDFEPDEALCRDLLRRGKVVAVLLHSSHLFHGDLAVAIDVPRGLERTW